MKLSKAFTAFAAVYFGIAFLNDGTFGRLVKTGERGAQDVIRGTRRLTRRI